MASLPQFSFNGTTYNQAGGASYANASNVPQTAAATNSMSAPIATPATPNPAATGGLQQTDTQQWLAQNKNAPTPEQLLAADPTRAAPKDSLSSTGTQNTMNTQGASSSSSTTSSQNDSPPPTGNAQQGSSGQDVTAMQNYLVDHGYLTPEQVSTGPGIYGPQTTAAVSKMQQELGIQPGTGEGFYGPKTQAALAQKYQQTHQQLTKSGTNVDSAGLSRQQVSDSTQGLTQGSSDPVFGAFANAMQPIMGALTQVLNNINNPALTAVSLQKEYNDLASQYNLPGMQTDLLNMQRIMNGTENDIRDELAKAGGGGSESQILAMSAGRNKVIMKQYNTLSTQYQAAQTNVQNMMQYASADKQMELQKQQATAGIIGNMASIETQMVGMGITMQNNARTAYQTGITNLGYKSFVAGFNGDNAGLFRAQQLLFPGSAYGTTLTDPSWVAQSETKWQQQNAVSAANTYFRMYGQWPEGFNIPGMPAPAGGGGGSTYAPYTGATVIGGIDFGKTALGVGAYATDIASEISGITRSYNEITGVMGQNPTASGLDSYIQHNSPNSPVTGQMITDAAKAANVSPAVLAATLNNESGFGTLGVGAKTNNPGNVGNTGTSTKTYDSWQAGVTATAQQLARRSVSQYSNSSNQIVAQAYQMVTGNLAPNQVRATQKGAVDTMANQISQSLYGKPFDAIEAQSAANFNVSTKTSLMKSSFNFTIATLSRLKDLSANVDRGSITYGNKPGLWFKYSGSDKATVEFVTQANAAVDDVGAALGGGISTDKKLEIAGKILDPTLSQEAFDAQVNTDIVMVASRLGYITSQSNLGGANSTLQMTGKDGATYAVPYDKVGLFTEQGYSLKVDKNGK